MCWLSIWPSTPSVKQSPSIVPRHVRGNATDAMVQRGAGEVAYAGSPGREDVVVPLAHRLSLVRYAARTSGGGKASGPSMVAALAGGRYRGDIAGAGAGAGRGTRDASWDRFVYRWAAFIRHPYVQPANRLPRISRLYGIGAPRSDRPWLSPPETPFTLKWPTTV
jgi:hypothetical protein